MNTSVIDIHCDLLSYLESDSTASSINEEDIGCAIPHLENGNVVLQVMAIYAATEYGSTISAKKQSIIYKNLNVNCNNKIQILKNSKFINKATSSNNIMMLASIENASCICEEDTPLQKAFSNLESILENTQKLMYIGLTHHNENRFGGGNSTTVGLKNDGKVLLDYLHDKKIAVDFSHTSDALANDIFDYINKKNLSVPVIASHSNYRHVYDHQRNLPNEIAKEIILRNGLIGVNFLRAFVNNENSDAIFEHILHGLTLGGANAICLGADFFCTNHHPDQTRKPFFHSEHSNASKYPSILSKLSTYVDSNLVEKIAHKNVIEYLERVHFFS